MESLLFASIFASLILFLVPAKYKHSFTLLIFIAVGLPLVYASLGMLHTGIPIYIKYSLAGFSTSLLQFDGLSAFFILIITFTVLTGLIYAKGYLGGEKYQPSEVMISIHYFSLLWLYFSMVFLCLVRDGLGFLMAWEIMTLSSFLLVIYKAKEKDVLLAGINYFVQMHISFLVILGAFLFIQSKTGIFGFEGLSRYLALGNGSIPIFMLFAGFCIKAGFVPFHTWLPEAHPAAPSHVSGIMSGVMIKMGIYGILRVISYMKSDFLAPGLIILALSLISSVYGVMQAILQHDLKRLLAWHSIENIGIIGIGIGIGLIGQSKGMPVLAFLGYTGAILHVFNHSLFKSLLFYTAGSVYLFTGSKIINRLGGLIKKMPWTAVLFLIAALAICGLPPFNGFVSEFLIFSGLFTGLKCADSTFIIIFILAIAGLALTGGLALFCFTKAFGITFLGSARSKYSNELSDPGITMLAPQLVIAIIILLIGIAPMFFFKYCGVIVHSTFGLIFPYDTHGFSLTSIKGVQLGSAIFLFTSLCFLLIRKYVLSNKRSYVQPTWACGYTAVNSGMQYTATSFASEYAKLSRPIISQEKVYTIIKEEKIFPLKKNFAFHVHDAIQSHFINAPVNLLIQILRRMAILQTGRMQNYIMYALIFLLICLILSLKNLI
jgi:hydrogenase-4 component B